MHKRSLAEHLDPNVGPKRILALDGGGIRGALTLGYLKRMETLFREKFDDPEYRLCDYFDLIGGTSTGSIIAAGLAIGLTVDELAEDYMVLGGKIFGEKRDWWNPLETWKYLQANYDYHALEKSLKEVFGEIKLNSDKILTGLCITAKRADTNSTWPLINHPDGKFFDSDLGKNGEIPLWQAIRASSAAPTYFAPQTIDVGDGNYGVFIDGGVSMANNPALSLLMVATMKGFPFHWKMGQKNLSIVSVGTGYSIFKKQVGAIEEAWMKDWAMNVPNMLLQDASWQAQILMQWMSDSPVATTIDMEMGDLKGDYLGTEPLIGYLRYNFAITKENLNDLPMDKTFDDKEVKSLLDVSRQDNRYILYEIGQAAAHVLNIDHFSTSSSQPGQI